MLGWAQIKTIIRNRYTIHEYNINKGMRLVIMLERWNSQKYLYIVTEAKSYDKYLKIIGYTIVCTLERIGTK